MFCLYLYYLYQLDLYYMYLRVQYVEAFVRLKKYVIENHKIKIIMLRNSNSVQLYKLGKM